MSKITESLQDKRVLAAAGVTVAGALAYLLYKKKCPIAQKAVEKAPEVSAPTQDAAVASHAHKAAKENMLSKYYTEEMKQKLGALRTAKGMSLDKIVRSGIEQTDSNIGVYAGDAESYELFAEFFDQIIRDYHRISADADIRSIHDLSPISLPDLDPENKRIISTRVRVARNLADFPFPALISKEERLAAAEKILEALSTFSGDLAGTYYPLEGMSEETAKQLIQDHFLFKKGDRFLESAGINQDWPVGRGIFHNDNKTFLVWTQEEDMLRVISMQPGGDIAQVFNRLSAALHHFETVAKFAKTDKLGYLTSCPTNLGTCLRASVHVKLPLASQRPDFDQICKELALSVRGIDGEHSESKGGIYDISNEGRLGKTEVQYLQEMYAGVKRLIEIEEEEEKKAASQ